MNHNPSVNRYLKDKAMDHIDHALGRPVYPLSETYRNHFATDVGSADADAFLLSPNWQLDGASGEMAFFSVTENGRWALSEHLMTIGDPWKPFEISFEGFVSIVPAKSRSSAKYAKYLAIGDCLGDMRFGDFVKKVTVRALPVARLGSNG